MYLQPLPISVQQRDGVAVVGVEVLARRHAVRVAEGVVGEGALHGERRGEGHHGVDLGCNSTDILRMSLIKS